MGGYKAKTNKFTNYAQLETPLPPSKVLWSPNPRALTRSQFGVATTVLKLYEAPLRASRSSQMELLHKFTVVEPGLTPESPKLAPLTSFDWSVHGQQHLVTSSVDATCTVWDVQHSMLHSRIITHDCAVYDVAWSPSTELFGAVGHDGTLRTVDLRTKDRIAVYFCHPDQRPYARLRWNVRTPHFVALLAPDQAELHVVDMRNPIVPAYVLKGHQASMSAVAWTPQSSSHLLSGDRSGRVHIWHFNRRGDPSVPQHPGFTLNTGQAINSIGMCQNDPQWIVVGQDAGLRFLRV